MKKYSILLFGDIHYPDTVNQGYVDRKDETFPFELNEKMGTNRLSKVLSSAANKCLDSGENVAAPKEWDGFSPRAWGCFFH